MWMPNVLLSSLKASLVFCVIFVTDTLQAENPAPPALSLPFWDSEDTHHVVGKLDFQAEPLQREGFAEGYPVMWYGCEAPRDDRSVWIYGWKLTNWQVRATRTIEIVRVVTSDGRKFTGEETVLSLLNPDWQGFVNIVRRPTDGRLFFFSWLAGILQIYASEDGTDWQKLTDEAYKGHDAMNVIWYPPFQEFVNFQNALEPYPKRYPDNIGELRRVLSFRRSKDAVSWDSFSPASLEGKEYLTPDDQDPIDLEFYRSIVFPTQGRYAMLLLDYIAPPPEANSRRKSSKHGPLKEVEWVISRDGINWSRNFRDMDATGQICALPVQGPFLSEGKLRFYERDAAIDSVTEGRIFHVTGRGNCEFSTVGFSMPEKGLTLDADVLYLPGEGDIGRAYVMAELHDENGKVLPGYEREKCLIENQQGQALPLLWEGKNGSELNGRQVRTRFYFREAKLYSLSSGK